MMIQALESNLFKRFSKMIRVFILMLLLFFAGQSESQTYTFTPAGSTGTSGPTQTMINTTYLTTNLNGSVTIIGAGIQSFTIPQTGVYRIHAFGASGGYYGGYGANSVGDFTFTSGTVLRIVAGQVGLMAVNGQNRGSGGGGGGSFVSSNTNSPLVVAGGGGGYGDGYASTTSNTPVCCLFQMNASLTSTSNPSPGGTNNGVNGNGGGCGVSSAGGGGGFYTPGSGCVAAVPAREYINIWGPVGGYCVAGSGIGGYGGGGSGYNSSNGNRGGGGGGYSGGGGGDAPTTTVAYAAGGGGSTYNSGTNVVNALNTFTGDGRVTIEKICPLGIVAQGLVIPGNYLCSGNSVTLATDAFSSINWSSGASGTQTTVVSPTVSTVYTVSGLSIYSCAGTGTIQINVNAAAPILTIASSSYSICLGDSIALSASGANNYSWSIPGNITSSSIVASPSVNTVYTVTGTNACGNGISSFSLQVLPLQISPLLTATSVCLNNTSTVILNSSANVFTLMPGNITFTNSTYILQPSVSTVYSVTGKNGVCRGNSTFSITVFPLPQIVLNSSASTLCIGNSATLTAGGGQTYSWNAAGLSGSIAVVSPTVTSSYLLSGFDSNGCANFDFKQIVVNPIPTISISQNVGLICAGKPATLSATGATSYTWYPGNLIGSQVMVNPTVSTVYTCSGASSLNCATNKTIALAVFDPSISLNYPSAICIGKTATIVAGSANSYSWNGISGSGMTIVSPSINSTYVFSALSYSLSLPCIYSVAITISVNTVPQIEVINASSNHCAGETNTILAFGGNTYSLNGVSTGSAIVLNLTTNTIITVSGSNQFGCTNTATLFINANECTGVKERTNNLNAIVYPNPSNGSIVISADLCDLILVDTHGSLIATIHVQSGIPIKLENLEPGIYFLREQKSSGAFSKKIVVYSQ